MTIALIAAALAVILWPSAPKPPAFTTATRQPPPPPGPTATSYQGAIQALAAVRARLVATDTIDEAERKAIDTLTLALVAGSDKP